MFRARSSHTVAEHNAAVNLLARIIDNEGTEPSFITLYFQMAIHSVQVKAELSVRIPVELKIENS